MMNTGTINQQEVDIFSYLTLRSPHVILLHNCHLNLRELYKNIMIIN